MVKDMLVGWDIEWKREVKTQKRKVSCFAAAVVIGFCRGLQREEVVLKSMKSILKFWEETEMKKEKPHIMVTLKGRFKGETGKKWHMLPLLYMTDSGIK